MGLLLLLSTMLYAQVESHLAYRRYTTQDGLPQLQTERLWQDSRRYIYISSLLPKQRRCIFRSANGQEVETKLLAPAFKRLQHLL